MRLSEPQYNQPVREKLRRASKKNPCVICGKTGCAFNNTIVICRRVSIGSHKTTTTGDYLHFRNDDFGPSHIPMSTPIEEPKASAEIISKVYESLLDCLVLTDKHTRDLEARGLTPKDIVRNRYRSAPTKEDAKVVCKYLGGLYDLDYVPGFYSDEEGIRRLNIKGSALFIPYRSPTGIIRGMQLRPDRGASKYFWFSSNDMWKGAASGSYAHYAGVDESKTEIYITEGGLKADCIFSLSGAMVVAMAGVNAVNYDTLMKEIKDNLPTVTQVVLAFDIDWKTNLHVKDALLRLTTTAQNYFKVEVEEWTPKLGKGYDDKLLKEKHGKNK